MYPAFVEHCSKWEKISHYARSCKSSLFQNIRDYIHELEHQHDSTSNTINHQQPVTHTSTQLDINKLFIDNFKQKHYTKWNFNETY